MTLIATFVALLSAAAGAAGAAGAGSLFWVSEPTLPGETLLVGAGGECGQMELRQGGGPWQGATKHIDGDTDYGCAVQLPGNFSVGEFEIRSDGGPPLAGNVARPWFLFGDAGDSATSGGWVRVVGEAIALVRGSTSAVLHLMQGGKLVASLPAQDGTKARANGVFAPTRWHAAFDVPASLPAGEYTASVATAAGATATTLCLFASVERPCVQTLVVKPPAAQKTDRFTVPAAGIANSSTAAVQAALGLAAKNGGGEVFFPRGQYFVKGALVVPPGTVLRGESRELVSIYFDEDNATTAPDAYVTGSGRWGVEDLTLYVTAFANNVVLFGNSTRGGFLRRSRIRYNSYMAEECKQGKGSRGRDDPWPQSQGTAVGLGGRNIFVTDNDIYSSGDMVSAKLTKTKPQWMHIARNRMWHGGAFHWGNQWKQAIVEDNWATGVSTTAMGSNYPQYDHNDGDPHVQNIYHTNNTQEQVWGNDREIMTFDGGGGVYYGAVVPQSAQNSTVLFVPATGLGTQPGAAVCVMQGLQTGECRRALSSSEDAAAGHTAWQLDGSFSALLDATSRVTIIPFVGHVAYNGNRFFDGGAVQFWTQALGVVAAENTFTRTAGLQSWGMQEETSKAWGPNLRVSFVDNEVAEGNHAFNWNTHPAPHNEALMESYFFRARTEEGSTWSPNAPGGAACNRFLVFRGNRVRSNGGVLVAGTTENVLVEGTRVANSDVGIFVNVSTKGVVLVANDVPRVVYGDTNK